MCARHTELVAIVSSSEWFVRALRTVASLRLNSWCIGAGAVRNLVWDHLHGYTEPSQLSDVDVAYFDQDNLGLEADKKLQAALQALDPKVPWEVTNQAAVHLWFESCFGHKVEPLRSLEDSVASWPEYATSVGITLGHCDEIQVIAPWGLDDLFAVTVRRNPTRVSLETYLQRITQKQYALRWPMVNIIT